jgi:poly-gamma-glutamate capsule biosynthesis protein CapA/YwtB (metallophosphatase superfamily)
MSKPHKLMLLARLLLIGVSLSSLNCERSPSPDVQGQPLSQPADIQPIEVTFLAVGDIMLSRGVTMAINRANDPLLPFKPLSELFTSTDFNFGNLESPFSGNDGIIGKGLIFNAQTRNIKGLTAYNFKILNLANNHAMDQRLPGLQYTQKYLEENGITHLGVGGDKDEAWQPKIINIRGMRIGFVGASYASFNDGGKDRNEYVARIEDSDYLRSAIAKLKSQADFIVVTMHAGIEYTRKPNQAQVEFAHTAIDSGADVVIGAHPHWIQTVESYRGKCIFYSLGNFIFDQEWSRETKEGLAVRITLSVNKNSSSVVTPSGMRRVFYGKLIQGPIAMRTELIPVVVENHSTPRKANPVEAQSIFGKFDLAQECRERN